jgi:hypothetical protein
MSFRGPQALNDPPECECCVIEWLLSVQAEIQYAVLLAGGPDGDFNVLTQSGEEFHEASDRKVTRAVPH